MTCIFENLSDSGENIKLGKMDGKQEIKAGGLLTNGTNLSSPENGNDY